MDKEGSSPARRSRDSRSPDTRSLVLGLWFRIAGYQVASPGRWFQVAGSGSLDTRSLVPGRGYQVAGFGSLVLGRWIPGRRCQVAGSAISDLHGLNSAVSIKMSHVRFSLGRKV
ncbi:UNVERIFIED_CONTAM: hypothetical protein Slati_0178100 [Sesamum latifolium]|uniref:Uncharacterized protein n=1 Tax=Sesamum latifolium TaxID=2727402 RepID=A0AAW2YB43_9LAMI